MNPENKLLVARLAVWQTRDKEEVLVGQRSKRSLNYPLRWEFPGGKIDSDEHPPTCGCRETREETGLHVIRCYQPADLTFEYILTQDESPDSNYIDWLIKTWVFEAIALKPETLKDQPPEHHELKWVTLEEANELQLIPQSSFALPYLRAQQNILRLLRGLDPLPPLAVG